MLRDTAKLFYAGSSLNSGGTLYCTLSSVLVSLTKINLSALQQSTNATTETITNTAKITVYYR